MTNSVTLSPDQSGQLAQILQLAITHHQAGQLQDAERLYRAILQVQPEHADAHHNLGALAVLVKQAAAGLPHFKKALDANPGQAQYWLSYIDALIQTGHEDVAREVLEQGERRGLQGDAVAALKMRMTPPSPDYSPALAQRDAGRYQGAIEWLQAWLEKSPQDAEAHAHHAQALSLNRQDEAAWVAINTALACNSALPVVQRNWARLLLKHQKVDEAAHAAQLAWLGNSNDPENQLVLATVMIAKDQIDAAKALVESALRIDSGYAEAYANLALLKLRDGDRAGALENAEKALSIKPHLTQLWAMVSTLRYQLKNLPGAIDALAKALEHEPGNIGHMANLGELRRQAGQTDESIALLEKAVAIAPDNANAWANLGTVLQQTLRIQEAEAAYEKALTIQPDQVSVINNLGAMSKDEGDWEEALRYFDKAQSFDPENTSIMINRAAALNALDQPEAALNIILNLALQSLRAEETWEGRCLFIESVKRLQFTNASSDVQHVMARALSEAWTRPQNIARVGANIVKLNPDIQQCIVRVLNSGSCKPSIGALFGAPGVSVIATNPLLLALLESAPVCDIELERFLTMARRVMLADSPNVMICDDVLLSFCCSLARQSFINEYIFAWTLEENIQACEQRDLLIAALEADTPISAFELVVVAAYFPLYSLPLSERLLNRQWPDAVNAVLVQQVCEPEKERQYRTTIPRLTPIEDEVSLLVQQQYEENPYPRWIGVESAGKPKSINDTLRRLFPLVDFQPLGKCEAIDILIAGCGTGQHPIGTAQRFQEARVLAVDLSLSSLSYAKRKTQELGLTSIDYAQADILKLGGIGRTFDVIESSGVLHHLDDPLAGWRVLLSLLRPGGVMKLGFYSELARRDIVVARDFIARQGYGTTAENIRQCRQEMMDSTKNLDFGTALKSGDFFSVSACRDLLFHVQEHRMTLAGIKDFLQENDLQFLGFELDAHVLQTYRLRFPDDRKKTNLDHWQIFESENPDTFLGMYQFWIQKPI